MKLLVLTQVSMGVIITSVHPILSHDSCKDHRIHEPLTRVNPVVPLQLAGLGEGLATREAQVGSPDLLAALLVAVVRCLVVFQVARTLERLAADVAGVWPQRLVLLLLVPAQHLHLGEDLVGRHSNKTCQNYDFKAKSKTNKGFKG